jgi:antitoxin ParD1/3/4
MIFRNSPHDFWKAYIMGIVRKVISLTDTQDAWIKSQVSAGRDTNDSEYSRDLIRREQERKAALKAIRAGLIEGDLSGEPRHVDAHTFKTRLMAMYG